MPKILWCWHSWVRAQCRQQVNNSMFNELNKCRGILLLLLVFFLLFFKQPTTQLPNKTHQDLFFLMNAWFYLGLFPARFCYLKLTHISFDSGLWSFSILYTFLHFIPCGLLCSRVTGSWFLISSASRSSLPRFILLFILPDHHPHLSFLLPSYLLFSSFLDQLIRFVRQVM